MLQLSKLSDVCDVVTPRLFCLLFGSWVVLHWLHNLYLHPLRKIPGPRLAAMSSCYEFYYDVLGNGLYLLKIKKLHEVYGKLTFYTCAASHQVG
jgi:hypothetical protein